MSVKGREIRKMSWELILGSVSASATGFLCDHEWIISYVIPIEISRRIQILIAQNECKNNAVIPHYLFSLVVPQGREGPSHRTCLSRVLLRLFIVSWMWSGEYAAIKIKLY